MGAEAKCTAVVGGKKVQGTVLLETDALLFRGGGTRVSIPYATIRSVKADGGVDGRDVRHPRLHARVEIMSAESSADVVDRFNRAFNAHDVDALADCLTDDTVFEDTWPPDGRRVEGKPAVLDHWRAWFARNPDATFDAEDTIVAGDRVVVCWTYRKMKDGKPWHIRGVDLFTVRDGKVAAKIAYVKG